MTSQSKLQVAGTDKTSFSQDLPERIKAYLNQKYLDRGKMAGTVTLVARRGQIAALECQGHMDFKSGEAMREDAIFRIYSMTKPITSVAAMMLFERGLLLLDDPVAKYLPAFAQTQVWQAGAWPNYITRPATTVMTVRDLMTHTAGLTYGFMNLSNVDYGYRKKRIAADSEGTLEKMVDDIAALPLEFDPGTRFHYSVATDVLGRIIEVVSGQSLAEFFQQNIFKPLGMVDTGFDVPLAKLDRLTACYQHMPGGSPLLNDSRDGESDYAERPGDRVFSGGGGLVSTVADYYRFCSMLANDGTLDGARIIGPRTLRLMTQNHLPGGKDIAEIAPPGMFSEMGYYGLGFGLGFSVVTDSAKAMSPSMPGEYSWGGMASTAFWVSPEDDDLIVIFMTQLMPSAATSVRRGIRAVIHGCLD